MSYTQVKRKLYLREEAWDMIEIESLCAFLKEIHYKGPEPGKSELIE